MASTIYLGTEEGVVTLSRSNGGWKVANQGVKEWSVQEVAADPTTPGRVLAATRGDGVWVSSDKGETWKKPSYGRRGPGKTRCITLDPRDPRRLFVGGEPIDIWISDDGGAHWDRFDSIQQLPFLESIDYPVPTVEPHVRDIALDPQDSDTIYAALQVGDMRKVVNNRRIQKKSQGDESSSGSPKKPHQTVQEEGGQIDEEKLD